MIQVPAHPSQAYIEGMVQFHSEGAMWYREHGQASLAKWARGLADEWRAKLPGVKRETGDGE